MVGHRVVQPVVEEEEVAPKVLAPLSLVLTLAGLLAPAFRFNVKDYTIPSAPSQRLSNWTYAE